MTILRAPSSFLTALAAAATAGTIPSFHVLPGGGGNGGLQLVSPQVEPVSVAQAYVGSNAAIAALIVPASRSISLPVGFPGPLWLRIPSAWLPVLLGLAPGMTPTMDPFQMSIECCTDIQGAWTAFFTALGWTPYTPVAVNWPVPVLSA